MIIKSIKLKDFRPYYKNQTIKFESNDKTITLIKAENGTGKTTLLAAFKWCFYGKSLKLPKKNVFVNEKAEAETPVGATIDVFVEIEFEENGIYYRINRLKRFKKTDIKLIEMDSSFLLKDISNDTEPLRGEKAELKIDYLLPEEFNFFFDGERLTEIENKTVKRKEIENILGIKAYNNAIKDLKKVKEEYNKKIIYSEKSEEEHIKLIEEKNRYLKKTDQIKEEIKKYEIELNKYIEIIDNKRIEKEKIEKEIEGKNEIGEKLGRKRESKEVLKRSTILEFTNYKSELGKKCSFIVADKFIKEAFNYMDKIRNKGTLPSNIKEVLIDDLLEKNKCICGNTIGEKEKEILLKLKVKATNKNIDEIFNNIYYKLKNKEKENTDEIIFKIKEKYIKYLKNEKKLDEAEEDIANLSKDFSEMDKEKLIELKEIEKLIEGYIERKGKMVNRIEMTKEKIGKTSSELTKIQNKINNAIKNIRNKSLKNGMEMTDQLINILEYLYTEKLKKERLELDKRIKQIYEKVTRKGYIVELDEKFNLQVFKKGLKDREVALSTGENKMLSLCFIGAIIDLARKLHKKQKDYEVGGGIYPIVLDSPYGDLDKGHKREMTNTINQFSDQIIIFASSSQWSHDVEQIMQNKVGKIYELINKNTKNSNEKYEYTIIKEVK